MDPLLSAYHAPVRAAGNGPDNPAGRDAYPQYRSLLLLRDAQGNTLVNQGNAFGLGETTLTVKRSLIPAQRRSALALRFALKLPTGNPTLLLGSGSVDAGISLDLRYSIGRDIVLYANAGGVAMGRRCVCRARSRACCRALPASNTIRTHRDSFVLQVDGSSLAVRTGNSFADRVGTTATFGYKRRLDRSHILTLSFSENGDIHNYTLPYFSDIGPDFTVYRQRWNGGVEASAGSALTTLSRESHSTVPYCDEGNAHNRATI